jgi:hypothetical protein
MFANTTEYFKWHHLKRRLRGATLTQACDAMFTLNHYAGALGRHEAVTILGMRKQAIYHLKDLLMRHLYDVGYCTGLRRDMQYLQCYSCLGTGWYDDDVECYKCDGTGVYRTIDLYCFTFSVEGQTYLWHVPASLVFYLVQVTDPEAGEFHGTRTAVSLPDVIRLRESFVTVLVYLEGVGLRHEIEYRESLRAALRDDWHVSGLAQTMRRVRRAFLYPDGWIHSRARQLRGRILCAARGHLFDSYEQDYCNRCERWIETVEDDPDYGDYDDAHDYSAGRPFEDEGW